MSLVSGIRCSAEQFASLLSQISEKKGYIYVNNSTGECVVFHEIVKSPQLHPEYSPLILRQITYLGNQFKIDLKELRKNDDTPSNTLKVMGDRKEVKSALNWFFLKAVCALNDRLHNLIHFNIFKTTSEIIHEISSHLKAPPVIHTQADSPIISRSLTPPVTSDAHSKEEQSNLSISETVSSTPSSAPSLVNRIPFTMELEEPKDKLLALTRYKNGEKCNRIQTRLIFAEIKLGSLREPECGKVNTVVRLLQYTIGWKNIDLNNILYEKVILDIFNNVNHLIQSELIDWLEKEDSFNTPLYISILNNYLRKETQNELEQADYANILKLLALHENKRWYVPERDYQKAPLPYNSQTIIDTILIILKIDRNATKYQAIAGFVKKVIQNGQLIENFEPVPLHAEDKFNYHTFKMLMLPFIASPLPPHSVNKIYDELTNACKNNKWKNKLREDQSEDARKILYLLSPKDTPRQTPMQQPLPEQVTQPVEKPKPVPKVNAILAKLSRQTSLKSVNEWESYKKDPASIGENSKKTLLNKIVADSPPPDYNDPAIIYLSQIFPEGTDFSNENMGILLKDAFKYVLNKSLINFCDNLTKIKPKKYFENFSTILLAEILLILSERKDPHIEVGAVILKLLKFYKQQKKDLEIPINDPRVSKAIEFIISSDPEGSLLKTKDFMEWSLHKVKNPDDTVTSTFILDFEVFTRWLRRFAKVPDPTPDNAYEYNENASQRSNYTLAEQALIVNCRDFKPEYIELLKGEGLYNYVSPFVDKQVKQ
ncbi:MAG: hypothetical protein WC222_06845 [Parachlamydiales bacterium]|jgi:hypothetical protein